VIPAYPEAFNVPLTGPAVLPVGSNLAVDITFYDRYDNVIHTMLPSVLYNQVAVTLLYKNQTSQRSFPLSKVQVPGKVLLYLKDSDLVFRRLPPRTNTYLLSIQVPTQQSCSSLDTFTRTLTIANQDKVAPVEVVGESDNPALAPALSSLYWDRVVTAGKQGRFAFTLRNPQMLQLSTWPSFIGARIVNQAGNSQIGNCVVTVGFGLYYGEYFGWFLCSLASPRTMYLQVLNGSAPLQGASLPFTIYSSNATATDLTGGPFVLGPSSGGLNLTFRLFDELGNQVDSPLISRERPHLGSITYSLLRQDGAAVVSNILPLFNSSGHFIIQIANTNIGAYTLQLNLPAPISVPVTFFSNSKVVSPLYSYAVRDNSTSSSILVN